MRLIKIEDYNEETMVLGKPIYDSRGRILIAAGKAIHPNLLAKVADIGISHLVIDDRESEGITLDEMIDVLTWMDAITVVKEAFDSVKERKVFPLIRIQKIVHKLINEIKNRKVVMLIPSSYVGKDTTLYAHSVNVAILALQTAKHLEYNDLHLRDIAIGALLHDIGKAIEGDTNSHTETGFNILRNIREISLLSAHIAMQHHESMDGTGYPRGLNGNQFHDYSQICGIANLFENYIHNENILPHEAVEAIMALNGIKYKEDVVKAFINSSPSYPPGTKVLLSNGEEGIVIKIKNNMHRPIIRIMSGEEISLEDNRTLMIKNVIYDVESLNVK